mmetsp:Transcript_36378/g.102530  ORF Transcript_36378/g.102530 Transcript_36378/m.102530 type:complete len:220 (-) Transcript_36378:695-1354(-)
MRQGVQPHQLLHDRGALGAAERREVCAHDDRAFRLSSTEQMAEACVKAGWHLRPHAYDPKNCIWVFETPEVDRDGCVELLAAYQFHPVSVPENGIHFAARALGPCIVVPLLDQRRGEQRAVLLGVEALETHEVGVVQKQLALQLRMALLTMRRLVGERRPEGVGETAQYPGRSLPPLLADRGEVPHCSVDRLGRGSLGRDEAAHLRRRLELKPAVGAPA